jgi:Pirin-related protein
MKTLKIEGRTKDLGDGFVVSRLLPYREQKMIGPFIFFDHMGPTNFPAGKGIAVRPHPHIGLATLTFLFEGSIRHRDSLGVVQDIVPGDVNLMAAGKGIVHSERSRPEVKDSGGALEGIQIWIALPQHEEDREPEFFHYSQSELPLHQEENTQIRIIMGEAFGKISPVKTYSPTFYLECQLSAGDKICLPNLGPEAGIYVVKGGLKLEADEQILVRGELLSIDSAGETQVSADEDSRFVYFGGESVGSRYIWWNFVSSSEEKIEEAQNSMEK